VWLAALTLALLWAYWPVLAIMAGKWNTDPQYSHGYLVPIFALVLLLVRRDGLQGLTPQPTWCGALVLLAAAYLRLAGAFLYNDWLEAISLLPCLAGICLLLGGWPLLRWSWPSIAFVFFMVPLPFRVETALAYPLQRIATLAGTYALQTVGLPALSEGNVIILGDNRVGVAEACSGLSMLLIFFALAFALILAIPRPLWQRVVLVAAALPIAVISNVVRITLTGVLYETAGGGVAVVFYHDLAGWVMMPLALGMFWAVLLFLDRLFLPAPVPAPLPISLAAPPACLPEPPLQRGTRSAEPGAQGLALRTPRSESRAREASHLK
jgi:exosortase